MSAAATALELSPPSGARSALRRLRGYIARHPFYYGVWLAVMLVYVAGFVALPLVVASAIGAVLDGLPEAEVLRRVGWLAAITAVTAAVRFYSRTLVFNAAREIEYELRNDIYAHLQRLPQSFYFRWRTGDLMSRCVNDINSVRRPPFLANSRRRTRCGLEIPCSRRTARSGDRSIGWRHSALADFFVGTGVSAPLPANASSSSRWVSWERRRKSDCSMTMCMAVLLVL